MYDNYNYPLGADDERAPWNQKEPDQIETAVDVYQMLYKSTYALVYEDEQDKEYFEDEYREDHYTPYELIEKLKYFLENKDKFDSLSEYKRNKLINECSDWEVEDFTVKSVY